MSSCGRLLLLCVALGVSLGSAHSVDSQVERGKSRHVQCKSPCPLYPRKRTFVGAGGMCATARGVRHRKRTPRPLACSSVHNQPAAVCRGGR
jgi:hypothetical protein